MDEEDRALTDRAAYYVGTEDYERYLDATAQFETAQEEVNLSHLPLHAIADFMQDKYM